MLVWALCTMQLHVLLPYVNPVTDLLKEIIQLTDADTFSGVDKFEPLIHPSLVSFGDSG